MICPECRSGKHVLPEMLAVNGSRKKLRAWLCMNCSRIFADGDSILEAALWFIAPARKTRLEMIKALDELEKQMRIK